MIRIVTLAVIGTLTLATMTPVWAMEEALLTTIKRITGEKIVVWAKNPIIVKAVKEAKREATKPLEEIIRLDKRWRATEGIDEWISGFLNNPCAKYLKDAGDQP